jgi:dTDP-4-amino-4,6-dideoxygalactose transaminase
MLNWHKEPPPTAGLPLTWRDFLPQPSSLEQDLATFLSSVEVQIECSGTAAIMVALSALKASSTRRSVIIPAYTCPFVPLAILRCGLTPILCDTRRNHFDLCPNALAKVCGDDTLAIMPTHLGGRLADIAMATAVAKKVGAYVVEDAAQALGARYQGQLAGTIGDVGCYSLGVGKGLTIYGGGGIVARNANMRLQLKKTAKEIVPVQPLLEAQRWLEIVAYYFLYRPVGLGLAFGISLRRKLKKGKLIEAVGDDCSAQFPLHRVSDWRKSIGANALKRLPDFMYKTRLQAIARKSKLAEISSITVIDDAVGDEGTWPYFLVLMPNQQARDQALSELWCASLGVGRLFIHALPDYSFLDLRQTETPNARDFAARTLTISNSLWLNDQDFMKIYAVLERNIA